MNLPFTRIWRKFHTGKFERETTAKGHTPAMSFDMSPFGFTINDITKGGPVENPIDPPNAPTDKSPKVLIVPYADTPDRWSEYFVFAHDFDGYAAYPDNLGQLANQAMKDWLSTRFSLMG